MAHIVAIANQKGGVGKTTTAVNLAASLAIAERRTLLLDADPQGNATSGLGIAKHELDLSLYDALVEDRSAGDVVVPVAGLPYLSALPATQDLVGAELQLVERTGREGALRKVLDQIERDYDYIVVDCPPSLGLLTLNVLAASHAVLIPIQCEYYGLEGISQLLNTVRLVQQNFNPGLAISGVLLTMYDARLNLCRQVAEDAKEYFGAKMFATAIPRNVRLAEAPSFGKPILLYDVQSVGAKSYLAVAQELMRRVENTGPVAEAPVADAAPRGAVGGEDNGRRPESHASTAPDTEARAMPVHEPDARATAATENEADELEAREADVREPETREPETREPEARGAPSPGDAGETGNDGAVAAASEQPETPSESTGADVVHAGVEHPPSRDAEQEDAEGAPPKREEQPEVTT